MKELDTAGTFTWADLAHQVQIVGHNVVAETQI